MAKLFTIDQRGKLIKAEEKPFLSETDDMEQFIKKNPQILGEVIIFGEQVVSSGRDKITDLIAVNKEREIIIIELKKDFADMNTLSQILRYGTHWKKSLEAVRNMWNKYENKPSDIEPDWNNYNPKMMIIAPSFDKELIEVASSYKLPIEFIEITRYVSGESLFVLINRVEEIVESIAPTVAREEYDWKWYSDQFGSKWSELAQYLHEQILKLLEIRGWNISTKFNKWYIAFKCGYRNAFWLECKHIDKVSIGINLREKENNPSSRSPIKWEWDKNWEHWYTEVDSKNFDIKQIENILEEAYKNTIE
jgi:hypothetical protein